MRKSEMNDWQLQTRNSVVNQLVAAGWDPRGWEILFAGDHELRPEAQAEYQNASFNLRVSYFVADEYLLLEAASRIGELAFALRLYPAGRIDDVVEAIIAWQDSVTEENYAEFIESLKSSCGLIVLQTGDELVEIS